MKGRRKKAADASGHPAAVTRTDSKARRLTGWLVIGALGCALAWGVWHGKRNGAPLSAPSSAAGANPERSTPEIPSPGAQTEPGQAIASAHSTSGSSSTSHAPSDEERANQFVNDGIKLLSDGRPAQAANLFEEALKIRPEDEGIHYNLGIALAKQGRWEAAKKAYQEALRIFPDYTDAHINLGNLLAGHEQLKEAIEQFKAAIQIEPERASAHNALGAALARTGDARQAVAEFEEAIRLQTNHFEAKFNLGNVLLAQGQVEAAIARLRDAADQQPESELAKKALQRALAMQSTNKTK